MQRRTTRAPQRQSGLSITRAADYAVRALIHLATMDEGTVMSQQEIASAIQVPHRFTGKVLQQLVAASFVTSTRGKRGGFCLTSDGRHASMLDVIVAIEGSIALNECISPNTACARAPSCSAHRVWHRLQVLMLDALEAARIHALADEAMALGAAKRSEPR